MILALLRRDLAQFFPFTGSGAALPTVFFVAVAMLFPFAVGPDAISREPAAWARGATTAALVRFFFF